VANFQSTTKLTQEHCNEIAIERGKVIEERNGNIVGAEKEKDETERERN